MSNVCTGCVLYCHSCRYYAASADLVVSTASKLADVLGCFSHQRSYKIVFQKTSLDSINVILLKFNFGKGIGRNFHIEGLLPCSYQKSDQWTFPRCFCRWWDKFTFDRTSLPYCRIQSAQCSQSIYNFLQEDYRLHNILKCKNKAWAFSRLIIEVFRNRICKAQIFACWPTRSENKQRWRH